MTRLVKKSLEKSKHQIFCETEEVATESYIFYVRCVDKIPSKSLCV